MSEPHPRKERRELAEAELKEQNLAELQETG